jgi:hypothetical protein
MVLTLLFDWHAAENIPLKSPFNAAAVGTMTCEGAAI